MLTNRHINHIFSADSSEHHHVFPTGFMVVLFFIGGFMLTVIPQGCDKTTFFLLSAWQNLFGLQTPIYNRPQLLNVYGLFDELCILYERYDKNERGKVVHEQLLEEIKFFSHADLVLKKYYPHIFDSIQTYCCDKKLLSWALSVKNELSEYSELTKKEIHRIVNEGVREKNDLISLLSSLATQARFFGAKDVELRLDDDEASSLLKLGPEHTLERIFNSIDKHENLFECIVEIEGDISILRSVTEKSNLKHVTKERKPHSGPIAAYIDGKKDSFFVAAEIKSNSIHGAARCARASIKKIVNVVNFCHSGAIVQVGKKVGIIRIADNAHFLVDSSTRSGTLDIKAKKNARQYAGDIIKKFQDADIPSNLSSSLELFALSQQNENTTLKFTNMWLALEAIANCGEGNIIEGMCSNLTSSFALNKIPSKIKNIAIFLKKIDRKLLKNFKNYLPLSFEKRKIQRDELFLLFIGKLGTEKQQAFCSDMECNPYVRYISGELSSQCATLRDIAHVIQNDKKIHEFQLKRFYRTRNMLFHSGESVHQIEYHLEILRYYYILAVYNIFERIMFKKFSSTTEALISYSAKYNYITNKNTNAIELRYMMHNIENYQNFIIS